MTPKQMTDSLYDANIRIDQMWLFPAWFGGDELADVFDLMIDEPQDLPPALADLVKNWSEEELDELMSSSGGSSFMAAMEGMSAAAHRAGLAGYLAVISTPVRTFTSDTSSYFSWGHTWNKLIFGETPEAFIAAALAWEEEMEAVDKGAES